jgi:hypothetical protein
MVKRTLVVLAILSLMVATAGTSNAFITIGGDGFGTFGVPDFSEAPTYVPVPCPPVAEGKYIVKTWSAKVVGPAPAGGPAVAAGPNTVAHPLASAFANPGLVGGIAASLATPFDILFGGFDGVYGCGIGLGGLFGDGPCGPCFGPVPTAAVAVPKILAAPSIMFGALW